MVRRKRFSADTSTSRTVGRAGKLGLTAASFLNAPMLASVSRITLIVMIQPNVEYACMVLTRRDQPRVRPRSPAFIAAVLAVALNVMKSATAVLAFRLRHRGPCPRLGRHCASVARHPSSTTAHVRIRMGELMREREKIIPQKMQQHQSYP